MPTSTNNKNQLRGAITLSSLLFVSTITCATAQTGANRYYNPAMTMSGKAVVIPAGTTLEGRIDTTIGSAVSKQGARFIIEMTSPLLVNGSDVLIPAGASILGEVVEAIPANKVPHAKGEKPTGKLRVQMNTLKMPDGTTYPLVASLVGEQVPGGGEHNPNLGGGIGYSGSSNSFEAVAPGRTYAPGRGRNTGPHVVTKQELMQDPILGRDKNDNSYYFTIRSLVKKKRNLYIYQGSLLSVHLDAPFKMGMAINRSAASPLEISPEQPNNNGSQYGHRRFSPGPGPAQDQPKDNF
jgi:hypothetical protein